MSLKTATNYDKGKEPNESKYSSSNTKMLLPNNNTKCFTSFHGKLFEQRDHLNEDCSRSFDILTFKKRKANVINLNHNLITLNNSLFINDPLNDSLQWCLEPGYQNGPKSLLFEPELNNDLYATSFDSKVDGTAASTESSRFNYYSNQNYELLSKRLDANLAEMDIETFSCRQDMNNLLNEINNKFSSTEDEAEGANEQLIDHCSVEDSLISVINERSNALRYEINGKPVLNSSFTINSNSNRTDDAENTINQLLDSALLDKMNETTNLESVGISVDSLDNSCFEQKCAEVVNKCKRQDKSKYKLTFEQMDESTNESLLNYTERYLTRIKRNEIYLNKLFDQLHQRLNNEKVNSIDKLSRSEYSTTNSAVEETLANQSSQMNDVSKLTKSLQTDLIHSLKLDPDDYVPLFNLNNSFNSESSSMSAPKSLIKLFIQNKNSSSPNSSAGDQLSGTSLDEQQQMKNQTYNENKDKRIDESNRRTTARTTTEVQTSPESMNQNSNNQERTQSNSIESGNVFTEFRNVLSTDTNTINNLKIYHNRKTSPIREEDEHEGASKEVKKYTSFQNVTAMYRNQNSKVDSSFQTNQNNNIRSDCPRSFSMNDFKNTKRPNLIKQYSLKGQYNSEQPYSPCNSKPMSMNRTNRNSKECSISSGYLSSGGSNNMFTDSNRKHFQQQRLFQQNHQQSTSCEDKQVQTSIYEHQQHLSHQPTPILINELPNSKNCCTSSNAPIYVYYPNYSLPDLHFVQNGSFQNIHLSPTKFQPANFDFSFTSSSSYCSTKRRGSSTVNKVNLRSATTKMRPKSTGDFEKLTKESLNHIVDWESLKTLLPDDIKELIKTMNLDEQIDCKVKSKTTSNTPTSNKTFPISIQQQNSLIKLRPKVLSRGSSIEKRSDNQTNKKRFSLQEPIYQDDCMLNCSTNTHSDASCCSNPQSKRGMIKSATMNMPIIMQQQQRQQVHSTRMFSYQTPCHSSSHSCCSLNQMPICHHQQPQMNPCCGHCSGGSGNYLNMMNNCCNLPSTDYYYQQQFKMSSPMKPCNPISELNEENEFESLNCLMENENENGELDFDRLLNCKVNNKVVAKDNVVKKASYRTRLTDYPEEFTNSKENFNDLKNHWEKVASKQTTPTTPNAKKSIVTQPQRTTKSQAVQQVKSSRPNSRYARSQVKQTQVKPKVNSRRSRSKSPEKSNKEVIILTKKTKPQVLSKPVSTIKTSSTPKQQIDNTNKSYNQQPKKPVRPSSLPQFKSMIPVAKNRSPPK